VLIKRDLWCPESEDGTDPSIYSASGNFVSHEDGSF
jgi:hypothetical protein